MENEFKERMEGLTSEVHKKEIQKIVLSIKMDLEKDGFENKDIYKYICVLIKEACFIGGLN